MRYNVRTKHPTILFVITLRRPLSHSSVRRSAKRRRPFYDDYLIRKFILMLFHIFGLDSLLSPDPGDKTTHLIFHGEM